jgi:hypothetical protein
MSTYYKCSPIASACRFLKSATRWLKTVQVSETPEKIIWIGTNSTNLLKEITMQTEEGIGSLKKIKKKRKKLPLQHWQYSHQISQSRLQCPGRFLGITGRDPSTVSKSNQLHQNADEIFRFPIHYWFKAYCSRFFSTDPLIFLNPCWIPTGHFSQSEPVGRFSPRPFIGWPHIQTLEVTRS